MDRREFSKMVTLGGVGMTLGAATQTAAAASGGSVSRSGRKAWARETWKGFENIVMASFKGTDLGQLDEEGIRLDIRQSIAHGFFSSLVEASALSDAELKAFMEIAADEAGDELHLALTTGPRSEKEIMSMLKHGEKVGISTFLLSPPREGSAEDVIGYIQRLARSTDMAAYLYLSSFHKFDRFHPSGVPVPILDEVLKEPNIVGAKIGTPEPGYYVEIFERYGDDFLPNSGWVPLMPLLVQQYGLQWSGGWTVEAMQSPEQPYAATFFSDLMAGNIDNAMELYWGHVQKGFNSMMKLMMPAAARGGHPWEMMKYFQFCTGGNGGLYRPDPSHPEVKGVTPEQMKTIRAHYESIGVKTTDLPDEAFAVGRVNYQG